MVSLAFVVPVSVILVCTGCAAGSVSNQDASRFDGGTRFDAGASDSGRSDAASIRDAADDVLTHQDGAITHDADLAIDGGDSGSLAVDAGTDAGALDVGVDAGTDAGVCELSIDYTIPPTGTSETITLQTFPTPSGYAFPCGGGCSHIAVAQWTHPNDGHSYRFCVNTAERTSYYTLHPSACENVTPIACGISSIGGVATYYFVFCEPDGSEVEIDFRENFSCP